MNSKKIYRIELVKQGGVAQDIAILACLSNGGSKYISLETMVNIVEGDIIRYPSLNEGISATLTGGHTLTIDYKDTNLLAITELEVLSLADECPTIHRQGTIMDENAKEILN